MLALKIYKILWAEYKHVKYDILRKGYDDIVENPTSFYYKNNNGRAKNLDLKYTDRLTEVVCKVHRDFIQYGKITNECMVLMMDFLARYQMLKGMKVCGYADDVFYLITTLKYDEKKIENLLPDLLEEG